MCRMKVFVGIGLLARPITAPRIARTPQLSNEYVDLLTWHCEKMDFSADAVCNLLWTNRHLTHTGDPTQLKGLNRVMAEHAPANNAQAKERMFGPMIKKCVAAHRTVPLAVSRPAPALVGTARNHMWVACAPPGRQLRRCLMCHLYPRTRCGMRQ